MGKENSQGIQDVQDKIMCILYILYTLFGSGLAGLGISTSIICAPLATEHIIADLRPAM